LIVRSQGRGAWIWEIVRRPVPLGVRLYGKDFQSEPVARFAGEAPCGLLQGMEQEQREA
jgi:hypothetical protein